MEPFSNALSLCQTDSIERKVLDALQLLDQEEEKRGELKDAYTLSSSTLELLGGPTQKQPLADTLKRLNDIHLIDDVFDLETAKLTDRLEALRQAAMMIRSELLCLSPIPTIRKRFVRATTDEASLVLELIKWCANYQMVIQALCINRERIGRCLLKNKHVVELGAASRLSDRQRFREVSDLPLSRSCKSESPI